MGRISNSHRLPWETLVTAQLWADSADIESSCQEKNNCQVNRAGKMSEPRGWRIPTLGGTGTWRVGPCMRGLGLPSWHASPQVATARSSGRGFLIGKDKNPRHNNRAVATRFVRHG